MLFGLLRWWLGGIIDFVVLGKWGAGVNGKVCSGFWFCVGRVGVGLCLFRGDVFIGFR